MSLSRHVNAFVNNGYLGVLVDARYPVDVIAWLQDRNRAAQPASPGKMLFDTRDLRKKHVVLIIEESFAGPVWRDSELRQRFLPHFSALAERGISFSRMYATGSRTTRGMEALLNGFAPLPGISTTERAGFERLPALARAMADGGFHPVFIYGGWPGFSNFSNYWRATGFKQIWTRDDFDEDFTTSWGVADQALFRRILLEMDKLVTTEGRVFLSTLTVSHHRPFDFPPGLIDLPAGERSSTYAMSYADASLGWFFNAAREKPWFDDTLFIVSADHGLRSRGDPLIPVDSYRIPFVIYANGVEPRTIDRVRSTLSLPQTLVELFTLDTAEVFHGRSLLCDCDLPAPVEYGYHSGLVGPSTLKVINRSGVCAQWTRAEVEPEHGAAEFNHPEKIGSVDTHCPFEDEVEQVFGPAYRHFYGGGEIAKPRE
jgi:phosphoglycerol transferase MdoB-like AlkP superfamily enzyme